MGVASPPPEDLPYPGIEPTLPTLQADSLPIEPWGSPADKWRGLFDYFIVEFNVQS